MTHKVIALTGGIASGKSTVVRYLNSKGYEVLDCDKIAKEVSCDNQVLKEVEQLLGKDSVKDGQLNRPYIRQIVFYDQQLLAKYNAIFFDRIGKRLSELVSQCVGKLVFVEIAILDAFQYPWFAVWKVESQDTLRAKRIVERDKVELSNALAIMSMQKQYDSACVLHNDGTLQQLYQQVDNLLNSIDKA